MDDFKVSCIDPGHGGYDSGACGQGLVEKTITLNTAFEVEHRLSKYYAGVNTILTRMEDRAVPLNERAVYSNSARADLFLSIHFNGFVDETANGFETYIHPDAPAKTRTIRDIIHFEIMDKIKPYEIRDRGRKVADFQVLRETQAPAVLIEPCFLTNPGEASLIRSNAFMGKLVQGICNGIVRALEVDQIRYQVVTDLPLTVQESNNILALLGRNKIAAHRERL